MPFGYQKITVKNHTETDLYSFVGPNPKWVAVDITTDVVTAICASIIPVAGEVKDAETIAKLASLVNGVKNASEVSAAAVESCEVVLQSAKVAEALKVATTAGKLTLAAKTINTVLTDFGYKKISPGGEAVLYEEHLAYHPLDWFSPSKWSEQFNASTHFITFVAPITEVVFECGEMRSDVAKIGEEVLKNLGATKGASEAGEVDAYIVSGAGNQRFNGTYERAGEFRNSPRYRHSTDPAGLYLRQGGNLGGNLGYGILGGEESFPGAWAYFCEPSRDKSGLQEVPSDGWVCLGGMDAEKPSPQVTRPVKIPAAPAAATSAGEALMLGGMQELAIVGGIKKRFWKIMKKFRMGQSTTPTTQWDANFDGVSAVGGGDVLYTNHMARELPADRLPVNMDQLLNSMIDKTIRDWQVEAEHRLPSVPSGHPHVTLNQLHTGIVNATVQFYSERGFDYSPMSDEESEAYRTQVLQEARNASTGEPIAVEAFLEGMRILPRIALLLLGVDD